MPNFSNSPLWAIELRIAELQERIRSLEAVGETDATTLKTVASLRSQRDLEIRRRDLCILRLLGTDYLFSPDFTESWRQMTAGDATSRPTPEGALSDKAPRRRQA